MLDACICMYVQGACVQNVLDSLVPALLADKNRKFIYVEQAISAFSRPFQFHYSLHLRLIELDIVNSSDSRVFIFPTRIL
jgi:hypothetical protein